MLDLKKHPANNYHSWEKIVKNEILPEGLRSGKIRLLTSDEIGLSPCLVASGAPRNPSGTHASRGYPGGRKAWIQAFKYWATKMPIDSLMGTLRRPYQHAAQIGIKLPKYNALPAREAKIKEVRIYCLPEDYGLTVWQRPAIEWSPQDWRDLLNLWVAEIKYRKQIRGSNNPYEDAKIPEPKKRIRDWEAVIDLSRERVLRSPKPWRRETWIKCTADAIWTVNRLINPRSRIVTISDKWEPLPDILIPSPSPFNTRPEIHREIEKTFDKLVKNFEAKKGKKLGRIIRKGEDIISWWRRLCSLSPTDLLNQSNRIGELWKEAENQVRESLGIPRIGEGWISEVELLNLVREVFPKEKVIHQASPQWLNRQHIDIFLPERKIAIEYQGEQHYVPIDYFGGSEGYLETRKRDERKKRLCAKNDIKLIYFRFDELITCDVVKKRIERASAMEIG